MKRVFSVFLILTLLLCCFAGCGEAVGEIAGNVADAAKEELEKQVRATFQEYKVDIIELKTAVGKLNGDSGDIQFFCAVLVTSDNDAVPQSVADSLHKVFHDAGIMVQSSGKIKSSYLEHKDLSFKYDSFDDGKTYYTVWCYTDKIPDLEDLKNLIPSGTAGVG